MWWTESWRADPVARVIADRHYNRQKVGSPQFVPPGRCFVLRHGTDAVWVTSWPFAQYVKHAWAGAWVNSLFRNESTRLSSEAIIDAVAHTRYKWPDVPELGMVSFVDASKVRHKRDPGRCYKKAGWTRVGFTKGGLVVYQILPADMPPAVEAQPLAGELWGVGVRGGPRAGHDGSGGTGRGLESQSVAGMDKQADGPHPAASTGDGL